MQVVYTSIIIPNRVSLCWFWLLEVVKWSLTGYRDIQSYIPIARYDCWSAWLLIKLIKLIIIHLYSAINRRCKAARSITEYEHVSLELMAFQLTISSIVTAVYVWPWSSCDVTAICRPTQTRRRFTKLICCSKSKRSFNSSRTTTELASIHLPMPPSFSVHPLLSLIWE